MSTTLAPKLDVPAKWLNVTSPTPMALDYALYSRRRVKPKREVTRHDVLKFGTDWMNGLYRYTASPQLLEPLAEQYKVSALWFPTHGEWHAAYQARVNHPDGFGGVLDSWAKTRGRAVGLVLAKIFAGVYSPALGTQVEVPQDLQDWRFDDE